MTWRYCGFWVAYGIIFIAIFRLVIINPLVHAITHQ